MVKLIKKENENKYPATVKDLLHTSLIPNWVELDLSSFSTYSLIGTGLQPSRNSGIYIHPDDIPLLQSLSVNFPEVLSHSFGSSINGTLTYRPSGQSTRILVSIPVPVMNMVKSIRVLSDIDKILKLGRSKLNIYTTGSGGITGYKVPNKYYNINEGRTSASITDFSCQYTSFVDLGNKPFIEKSSHSLITKDQSFDLLIGLLKFTSDISREKKLKGILLSSLISSLDQDLLGVNITEDLLKENIEILLDLKSDIFVKEPDIKIYTYSMYFTTIKQVNTFFQVLGKTKAAPSVVEYTSSNRNDVSELNIYVFRPDLRYEENEDKRKHILSILSCPTGQYKISSAIGDWDASLSFSSTGHLDTVG